jgi:hypothetical protein
MTEEQRMEEGRRMFQIFAARMFEQRVLTAYKEKVSSERQASLIEELEREERENSQKAAKKAKMAQKKKDKAQQKKQAQAEEKAKREAEEAEKEAARLADEERKADEARQRAEEKRKKKEAQKKAEEDERLRKEAERQRRAHEQREKQAEQERKARDSKERKLREQREKEAREQKEREIRERKERQDREKREREARSSEAKEKSKQDDKLPHKGAIPVATPLPTQPAKRAPQPAGPIVAALPQHPANTVPFASPRIPVATPAIPKAPTPIRSRQTSQQHDSTASASASQSGSGPSQNPSPHPVTPLQTSPAPSSLLKGSLPAGNAPQSLQSTSPQMTQSRIPSGTHPGPFGLPPMAVPLPHGMMGVAPPPGLPVRMPHEAMFPGAFRPNIVPMAPPGINGPAGRGFPVPHPPPGFNSPVLELAGFPLPKEPSGTGHSRQGSQTFDSGPPAVPAIGRPNPIGRPGSVVHGQRHPHGLEMDDIANQHLGSKALLDDSEEPYSDMFNATRRRTEAPGPRHGFPQGPFMDPQPFRHANLWGPSNIGGHGFPPPPGFGAPGPGWGAPGPFAPQVPAMAHPPRTTAVAIRSSLCRACQALEGTDRADPEGYIELAFIKAENQMTMGDILEEELLDLCDTEGNQLNGGGSFEIRRNAKGPGRHAIRWVPDTSPGQNRPVGAPGEIGSPVIGSGTAGFSRS